MSVTPPYSSQRAFLAAAVMTRVGQEICDPELVIWLLLSKDLAKPYPWVDTIAHLAEMAQFVY